MLLRYGSITQNLIESLNRETRNQRVNKFIVIEYILLIKYSINFNDKFEPKTLTTQSYRVRRLLKDSMVHIYIGKFIQTFGILHLSRFGFDIHNESIYTKELNKDKNAWP